MTLLTFGIIVPLSTVSCRFKLPVTLRENYGIPKLIVLQK